MRQVTYRWLMATVVLLVVGAGLAADGVLTTGSPATLGWACLIFIAGSVTLFSDR